MYQYYILHQSFFNLKNLNIFLFVSDTKDSNNLESEASQTGDLILFLDQLFDSLNGQSKTAPPTKPLKASVTKNSNHQQFWNNSLEIINSMRFYCNKKKAYVRNPSLKNLQFTLRGFLYLKNVLLHEKQFSYILTRTFNQDPLENFFSYIRSYGSRNTNPDASHFLTSFKALIVNNFMSAHSPHSNCEEDTNTYALDNLRSFLTGQYIEGIQPIETPSENVCLPLDIPFYQKTKVARCTITYMSGYIARVLLKYCKNCEICKQNLCIQHSDKDQDFIQARQFDKAHLIRPSSFLLFLVSHSLYSLFYCIPRYCHISDISKYFINALKKNLNLEPLNCSQHDLGNQFCKLILRCSLFWWSKSVNKIAKGKDSKFSSFLSTKPDLKKVDPIKLQAHKRYLSKRKHKG